MGLQDNFTAAIGQTIYLAAKAAALEANEDKVGYVLSAKTLSRLELLFPEWMHSVLKQDVVYCPGASLAADWIVPGEPCAGMVFGDLVFIGKEDFNPDEDLWDFMLLVHELVHVKQCQQYGAPFGELAFAYAYAAGFIEAGSYRGNPLEAEARDHVKKFFDYDICNHIAFPSPVLRYGPISFNENGDATGDLTNAVTKRDNEIDYHGITFDHRIYQLRSRSDLDGARSDPKKLTIEYRDEVIAYIAGATETNLAGTARDAKSAALYLKGMFYN